jgi:hypothetical protein
MSSGDGGGFFDDPLGAATDGLVQLMTGGTFGYKDGRFQKGVTSKAMVDGTKEVTGAAAAEEANLMAREQFEAAQADAVLQRKNDIQTAANRQIQQSRTAGAAKSAGRTSGGITLGDTEKDFLGL